MATTRTLHVHTPATGFENFAPESGGGGKQAPKRSKAEPSNGGGGGNQNHNEGGGLGECCGMAWGQGPVPPPPIVRARCCRWPAGALTSVCVRGGGTCAVGGLCGCGCGNANYAFLPIPPLSSPAPVHPPRTPLRDIVKGRAEP